MIPVDGIDRRLVRELQDSIPLTENPYATIADRLGLTEDEVVERLQALRRSGRLKRIGAVLRHREAGFGANAMVVFAAPPEAMLRDVLERHQGQSLILLPDNGRIRAY